MADSIYDRQVALTRKNYQDTLDNLQKQRTSAEQSYGFDDASNPYSQAKLLERSYKENQAGTSARFAASGGLYSGALQRAKERGTFEHNRDVDQTRRQYQEIIDSLEFQKTQAGTQEQMGVLGADEAALARAQAQAPVDPGVPVGTIPGPNAPSSSKTKLPQAEYLRRLRAIRDRHGAGSPEVQRFRERNTY